jgi:hypothetical protein
LEVVVYTNILRVLIFAWRRRLGYPRVPEPVCGFRNQEPALSIKII